MNRGAEKWEGYGIPNFRNKTAPGYHHEVYRVVKRIPKGKITTYGQIAKIVGRCTARMVGYALAALPYGMGVPWHRVINSKGEISPRARGDGALRQRKLLEKEGIRFDRRGRVDLKKIRWKPEKEKRRIGEGEKRKLKKTSLSFCPNLYFT